MWKIWGLEQSICWALTSDLAVSGEFCANLLSLYDVAQ
jgi:hypothetical protein